MGALCPTDETLAGFVQDELSDEARLELEQHVEGCSHCAEIVAYAGVPTRADAPPPLPEPGSKLGRYHVLELIGRGAMGAVYSAYDPQLHRRVALKVQLPTGNPNSARQDRFVREAQAMASVSHPNVISVHDVGVHEGVAFFAMEHVEGRTLRRWLEGKPSPSEVLAAFIAAGRGIAAAHAQGLVHRDFKPDNVLVGDDSRVRVIDFGLVRFVDADVDADPGETNPGGLVPSRTTSTRTGTLIGTPAYMAPEQLRGQPADAHSDQFSFCVALYEGLVGERPFRANTLAMLLAAMDEPVAWPSTASRVPRRIRLAIERGLRVDPKARFGTMGELVALLEGRRWDRWIVGSALGIGMVGFATAAQAWFSVRPEVCAGARDQLVGVWDDNTRDRVHEQVLATGLPNAEKTWRRLQTSLDGYADRWTQTRTESCEATSVRREASADAMDLRMGCLDRSRTALAATVGVLAEADAEVVLEFPALLEEVPDPAECLDINALSRGVAPPAAADSEVVGNVRVHLADARAERAAGRAKRAYEHWQLAAELAGETSYGPLKAELELTGGRILEDLGRFVAAEQAFSGAIESAGAWHQWEIIQEAATRMIHLLTVDLARAEAAKQYLALAQGLAEGDPDMHDDVALARAEFLEQQGEWEQAEALLRRTIVERTDRVGPRDRRVLRLRNNLALSLGSQGQYEDALTEYQALVAAQEAEDPTHWEVAAARANLASAAARLGNNELAETEFRAALDLLERTLGADHPRTLLVRGNLAHQWTRQERNTEAEAELRKIISRWEARGSADHPWHVFARTFLSRALYAQGEFEAAETELRAALEIQRRSSGPNHPRVAESRRNLGVILVEMGKTAQAEAELTAALAIQVEAVGPGHPSAILTRSALGHVLALQDRHTEALEHRRAIVDAATSAQGFSAIELSSFESALADSLLALGRVDEALTYVESVWARDTANASGAASLGPTIGLILETAEAATTEAARGRVHALMTAASEQLEHAEGFDGREALATAVDGWLAANPVSEIDSERGHSL